MICLFGGLIRLALYQEDYSYDAVADKLGVDVEMIKNYENNISHPNEAVIASFCRSYNLSESNLNFYIFHEEEPKKVSKKVSKFLCVKISQLLHFYLNKMS